MPEKKDGSNNNELLLLLGLIFLFGYLWWMNNSGRVPPLAGQKNIPSENVTGNQISKQRKKIEPPPRLILGRGSADKEHLANREYLTLSSSQHKTPLNISGWSLIGIFSRASLPPETYLYPNEKIYIHTGRSPVGAPFQTNLCTGYWVETHAFYPPLKQDCPRPADEAEEVAFNLQTADCRRFVQRLPRCRTINSKNFPADLPTDCRRFVLLHLAPFLNYGACFARHLTDNNFYRGDHHIYLNSRGGLWRDDFDTIKLFDTTGNLRATLRY